MDGGGTEVERFGRQQMRNRWATLSGNSTCRYSIERQTSNRRTNIRNCDPGNPCGVAFACARGYRKSLLSMLGCTVQPPLEKLEICPRVCKSIGLPARPRYRRENLPATTFGKSFPATRIYIYVFHVRGTKFPRPR